MIRFATWIAVSSKPQAKGWKKSEQDPDAKQDLDTKDSLPEQERRCRAVGLSKNWVDTGLVYAAPGISRTRWVDVTLAEHMIPDLFRLLEDAKGGLYDVLILYHYNRLRDLQDGVAKALNSYGVQLYSVNQGVEPLPPEEFRYSRYSDAESTMRGVNQITSRQQTSDLRRMHEMTTRGRTQRGLHPSNYVPYGYIKQHKAPARQDPVRAATAIQIKDLFLAGQSVPQIIDWLAAHRIPSPLGHPRWVDYTVRYLLINPFYAGKVSLGRQRKINDPRIGKSRMVPGDPARILWSQGVHEPIWDEATHLAILAEMKRRAKVYKGPKTYRLSHLLYCPEHNRVLYVYYMGGHRDDEHRVWACPAIKNTWHLFIRDTDALARLTDRLVQDLTSQQDRLSLPSQPDRAPLRQAALDDLAARRSRLVDALESGALDPATYAERVAALDAQLTDARQELAAVERRTLLRQQQVDELDQLGQALQAAPAFLAQAPAQIINTQLRSLIEKVIVRGDNDLEIVYRFG